MIYKKVGSLKLHKYIMKLFTSPFDITTKCETSNDINRGWKRSIDIKKDFYLYLCNEKEKERKVYE